MRAVWMVVGLAATGFGMAGVVLPLVPTTPFLLLAVFAFARSSPRLHTWLVTHPRLGPMIESWRRHGAIGRRAKIAAMAMMVAALAGSWAAGVRTGVVLLQAAVLVAVAAFILSRPDAPPDPPS
ncbi:MAG: YbaN family protein [Hyphomicrobiaceae bacterium]|nr:YbaN family protein [Hyphomicrobiaceae bacterium]